MGPPGNACPGLCTLKIELDRTSKEGHVGVGKLKTGKGRSTMCKTGWAVERLTVPKG